MKYEEVMMVQTLRDELGLAERKTRPSGAACLAELPPARLRFIIEPFQKVEDSTEKYHDITSSPED